MGDGPRVPILATDPMSRYQYLPLTPQEAYLHSRIDNTILGRRNVSRGIRNFKSEMKKGDEPDQKKS